MASKETTTSSEESKTSSAKKEKSASSQWRQSIIAVSILALAGLFFALNYLIYIPHQQRLYNEKVFRILHEESEEFKTMINGYKEYFVLSGDTTNVERPNRLHPPEEKDSSLQTFKDNLNRSFKGFAQGIVPQVHDYSSDHCR
jgi:hypothetical protein